MPPDGSAPIAAAMVAVDLGFEEFSRERWAAMAHRSDHTLSLADTRRLVATGDPVSLDEVVEIYLPLAQLLEVIARKKREALRDIGTFLDVDRITGAPFIIGIAGGVAVGKSTTARVLQALLRENGGGATVDLLTTDGFLYPNATLAARGLMGRKGFPESYDQRALIGVLAAIRSGATQVKAPIYSHVAYDIVPGEQVLRHPDIVIVEGLNVLQVSTKGASPDHVVVSDFFDFSIYVDAAESDVAQWFRDRLLSLRSTVLREPDSFFHRFTAMSDEEVSDIAQQVWDDVNLVNLRENVAPTRGRADLIMEKNSQHLVERILLKLP